MSNTLQKLGLEFNPFEPAATGAPLSGKLAPPSALANQVQQVLDLHQSGHGVKAIVIVGEYGAGKSCLLRWLHDDIFPERQIKSFYFDNPGVQFYDLANALLRTIGRKDFAKFIWELAGSYVSEPYQRSLLHPGGYEEYLSVPHRSRREHDVTTPLQDAIKAADVTADDQIANCLARVVTDSKKKPYFEYRDFVPRQSGSLVAEGEEAPYFGAILRTITRGYGASGIAFLIDEFEEIGLQKRLTKRAAHDYLATLKRLVNLTESEENDFWLVLSMTPDAYDTTCELEPALSQRFSQVLRVEPLTVDDAIALMSSRLEEARHKQSNIRTGILFPFPDDIGFRRDTYSNPRRLVQACFRATAHANDRTDLPFSEEYLREVENARFPT